MEVNSFWHGERLTTLERLCISSFLQNGIGYNLYLYDEPAGLPDGVILRDAAEIVPRGRLFYYPSGGFNAGSVAGFANLFRYSLIHSLGGWWVDIDLCCVNAFTYEEEEFYLKDPSKTEVVRAANALFKAPAGSDVMQYCLTQFAQKDVTRVVHGETGPNLLTEALVTSGKASLIRENDLYFPIPWWNYARLFADEKVPVEHCHTVHFWNAMIREDKLDKDAQYPTDSVFERMKRKYLSA
jgi:hypothetical protein